MLQFYFFNFSSSSCECNKEKKYKAVIVQEGDYLPKTKLRNTCELTLKSVQKTLELHQQNLFRMNHIKLIRQT